MPDAVCASMIEKYREEMLSVEDEIIKTKKSLEKANVAVDGAEEYLKKLISYGRCESLTREMCL